MIGRKEHIKKMTDLLKSGKSEFLAITGRRRVGKTFLVDNVYKDHVCFNITGIQNGSMEEQLLNFRIKLSEHSKTPLISAPKNWQEAFFQLKTYLSTLDRRKKKVIFIDELPWIYTPKSKFIQMLAHFWNDYLSKEKNFILVICGSATSWILKKIVNDKGGLHNRISEVIKLLPFTLYETKLFLESKKIKLTNQEIAKIYMAMGGIPYYLEKINKGESAAVAIERMCFADNGILKYEYDNLYKALFKNAEIHESIVETLAKSRYGLSRNEILKKSKLSTNGSFNRAMEELLQSGFLAENNQFGRKKWGSIYMLNDEYSIFYHRFIKPNRKYIKGIWLQLSNSQSYKIWTGYAFELLSIKHISQIKKALGISGVYVETSTMRIPGTDEESGFQIDLIIDRKDATINLCEMKYYDAVFKIDRQYANKLIERKQRFIEHTKTRKQVFNTFITNHGVLENKYYLEVVDSQITLNDLMKAP